MYPVVIIEDEAPTREYLRLIVESTEDFCVAADFGDAESAMLWFDTEASCDVLVVLSDLQLPELSGIDFMQWLHQKRTDVLCLVLSAYDDADRVFKALKAGAVGYILKGTDAGQLVHALRDVIAGGSPMSSQIARRVVTAFSDLPYEEPTACLSQREHEILTWLAKGFSYQEIADKVFLSVETVRTHIRNMYKKLQVRNKMEALKKARMK
ncbi:MAG: response regulator transcription factor [Bacteroidetes bacterium]|nr:response regulator transcription factor [Bacteroidota bacterium]